MYLYYLCVTGLPAAEGPHTKYTPDTIVEAFATIAIYSWWQCTGVKLVVQRRYPRRKFSGGAAPLLGLCGDGCGLLQRALAA